MALPLLIGAGLASFAVSEVIAALLESWTGDPESSVTAALAQIQQKAQYDAMTGFNQEAEVKGDVARAFKGATPRGLGELALYQQGVFDTPTERPTLGYVTQRLGISPQDFMQRTSPTRMGDLSGFQRVLPPDLIEKGPTGNGETVAQPPG
jgi:hypothetical protein